VTYRSTRLGSALGLKNLWIAFSGYWPERGATLETATFKELEAQGVLSRMCAQGSRTLVVASAGNTAAAFARAASENDLPCLIVVPECGMNKMKFGHWLKPSVKIICLTGGSSYSDAIAVAEQISQQEGFISEGGVKNVGRRDGMATVMYSAVESIGRLPDYYFQAVGSGSGAIAAHEAAKRLVEDSRFGPTLPRLMLAQNAPFTPIYDSWRRGRRELVDMDPSCARNLVAEIVAKVLSNQRPPYSVIGGMFDVLCESQGDVFSVCNEEALQAMKIFERCEGIDIDPAAGVAVAALMNAAGTGQISSKADVLLHITGGGARRRAASKKLFLASPDLELPFNELDASSALQRLYGSFANYRSRRATA
jgi:cysteate synthase